MCMNYNARATPLYCLLNPLFSDVTVRCRFGFLKLSIITTDLNYLRHLSLISKLAEAVIFWTINAWKSYQRINFRGDHPFHWGKLLWHPSTGQEAKKAVTRLISQRYHKTVTVNPASHSSLTLQPDTPAFTKSRTTSDFPSRFLNIKQHRGHKMIRNCAKSIIDWFET